jgi:anti-sigma B factor antagonist
MVVDVCYPPPVRAKHGSGIGADVAVVTGGECKVASEGGLVLAMELQFDVTSLAARDVLAVRGEIDAFTSPRLRERLAELMDDGHFALVVDLEGVDFMDSTGLGVLVSSLKRAKEHGGELSLVCTSPQILRVLSITGLDRVFEVRATIDDGAG